MLSDPSSIPFIIWTDETSFWRNKSKSGHGWVCRDGEDMDIESEAPINLNGPKVHVWGAISAKGKFKLYLFEENLTSELYIKILRSRLAEMKKVFPEGFYFMHDNDPKHKSRPVKEFAQKNLLEILPWPSYSPDFNLIERVWAWLKKKIAADSVENITELKKSIKKHWKSIPTNYICNLINTLLRKSVLTSL